MIIKYMEVRHDLIIGIIVLCTQVFNFVVLGLSFIVAVGMVSWAGVGDHRWKKDALLETSSSGTPSIPLS
jgi:hypothetical protein